MKKLYLSCLLVFIILIFDLGNPDALRQGTEGFYLQVASEMFSKGSFLTPYYLDAPHWSKPPLLFLLPQLLYYLQSYAGLFVSRLSVLIFSILLVAISSKKIGEISNIKSSSLFLFLFSTVGFFKYSRIFMMEMPLILLAFLSAIYFFSFLQNQKRSAFWWSVFWGVLSCQVKGPVAFAMLIPSFGLYGIYHFVVFKRLFLKEIFFWSISAIVLSSGWFIYEYNVFGQDFINYFFLRENLGKFTSKSYPITNVIQGLILYSLPWSLLLPAFIWKFKKLGAEKLSKEGSKFTIFLLICFACFFILWLIPQQRSHHYAMPAIPFFLSLIYLECFNSLNFSILIKKIFRSYILFFSILGLFIVSFTLINKDQFLYSSIPILITGLIVLLAILFLTFRKSSHHIHFFISHLLLISVFWSLFIPNYLLPLVPQSIKEETKEIINIGAVHRKPYFISSSLERDIKILAIDNVQEFLNAKSSAVIIDGPLFLLLRNSANYLILKEWNVWKRGIRVGEIFKNLKAGTIKPLRSKMYLIKAK